MKNNNNINNINKASRKCLIFKPTKTKITKIYSKKRIS